MKEKKNERVTKGPFGCTAVGWRRNLGAHGEGGGRPGKGAELQKKGDTVEEKV